MKKIVISLLFLSVLIMPVYAGLFDEIDQEVLGQKKQYKYWWEKAIDNCGNDIACQKRVLIRVGKDIEERNRILQHLQTLDGMYLIHQDLQDISNQQAEYYRQQRLQQEMMYNQNQIMYDQWQLQNFMNH